MNCIFEHQVDGATIRSQPEWSVARAFSLLERLLCSSRDGFFETVSTGRYAVEANDIINRTERCDPVSLYVEFLKYETEFNGEFIPCEQTPRYLFFVQDILKIFPEARIVNMVRDPRDVLASQKNKWKRRFLGAKKIPIREAILVWSNYHPFLISKLWVSCVRQGQRFDVDHRVKTVRFEDILNDLEGK